MYGEILEPAITPNENNNSIYARICNDIMGQKQGEIGMYKSILDSVKETASADVQEFVEDIKNQLSVSLEQWEVIKEWFVFFESLQDNSKTDLNETKQAENSVANIEEEDNGE